VLMGNQERLHGLTMGEKASASSPGLDAL
jgi:hypothetical protein